MFPDVNAMLDQLAKKHSNATFKLLNISFVHPGFALVLYEQSFGVNGSNHSATCLATFLDAELVADEAVIVHS